MSNYLHCRIKSFKHDGKLHRMWMDNWMVPIEQLAPAHQQEGMQVLINDHTVVRESNGQEWISRMPGVSFYIPKQWFNVTALLEESGVRYYCNVASPFYCNNHTLTYIDYDLDVIRMPSGEVRVVDEDEYEYNKQTYRYSNQVQQLVQGGLEHCLKRIRAYESPFDDRLVQQYYRDWKNSQQRI